VAPLNKIDNCPLCGHVEFETALQTKDHMITQQSFTIVSCKSCGFWFTNPIPKENEIGEYYKHETYVSHSSSSKGFINGLYKKVRNKTLKEKLALVRSLVYNGTVIDYGCGTGHFLSVLNNAGYKALGFEPDEEARKFTKENLNLNTKPLEKLNEIDENTIDLISLWHVLEHVYHLKRDLKTIVSKIKPEGYLIIAVPNRESYDAKIYGEYWAAYDVPRHLYHFTQENMRTLAKENNLTLEKTLPMLYDSFYVSMLSEKYKKGSILKAFYNGLKSNLKAKEGGYSSQIYIFKKK
jgi:2-polyprenyl-3-methyl-5-hydroxy-6-metoxy-1,4-benzoquinol methylase